MNTAAIAPHFPDRLRTARLIVGFAAILGTLPYLTLKLAWLTGGTIGLTDPAFVRSPELLIGNAFTGGMDVVAIVAALAFTYRWGQRVPAGLVLFPLWVGTGFLAPIALDLPFIAIDLGTPSTSATIPLENWVWGVVYVGFAWQGVMLLTAFALYAKARWATVFAAREVAGRVGAFAQIGTALTVVAAGSHFVGASTGNFSARVSDVIIGLLALLAVAGVFTLGRGRLWPSMVLVWVGAGALFSWGFWSIVGPVLLGTGTTWTQVVIDCGQILGAALLMVALTSRVRRVSHGKSRS
jgi:hypothetical protein